MRTIIFAIYKKRHIVFWGDSTFSKRFFFFSSLFYIKFFLYLLVLFSTLRNKCEVRHTRRNQVDTRLFAIIHHKAVLENKYSMHGAAKHSKKAPNNIAFLSDTHGRIDCVCNPFRLYRAPLIEPRYFSLNVALFTERFRSEESSTRLC